MASTTPFLTAVAERRSAYNLLKESPISNERILELVTQALTHAPSPFNVRSARCIVLFGDDHSQFWQNAYTVTEQQTPASIGILGPKIRGMEAAYGTCLFLDDASAYNDLTPRFQAISKLYPEWEEHSSGMNQFILWTALAAEGLGCNMQHYQPSITPYVRDKYALPEGWSIKSQLVFGKPEGPLPEAKVKTHLDKALRVYGN